MKIRIILAALVFTAFYACSDSNNDKQPENYSDGDSSAPNEQTIISNESENIADSNKVEDSAQIVIIDEDIDKDLAVIIKKNIDARGGLKNIRNINTIYYKSKMSGYGPEIDMELYYIKPNTIRNDMTSEGKTVVMVVNDKTGWAKDPSGKIDTIPQSQVKFMRDRLINQYGFFESPFVNYKEKGLNIEMTGETKKNGKDYYKIRLYDKKSEVFVYVEKDTYLDVLNEMPMEVMGKKQTIEMHLKNNKKIGGVVVPMEIQMMDGDKSLGKIVFSDLKINEKIDPEIFKMPKK